MKAATGADKPWSKLREREPELDKRASLIDTQTELTFGETLEIAARGMFLVRHFLGRFLTKMTLMFFAITVPVTIIPWPTKVVIDHVVLGRPIEEATGYPPIRHPFLDALAGATPLEVLLAVTAILVVFVLLIGGYAQGDNARDETEASLEEGHDTATPGRGQPARRAQLPRRDLRLHRLQDQHAPHAIDQQRIAIARGLLRDSRILILDEPTSALDPETEEYLVRSLQEAARDRLVIIIAHRLAWNKREQERKRPGAVGPCEVGVAGPEANPAHSEAPGRLGALSTIAFADKIVFLEDGKLLESGSHEELMALPDGHYRRFVELQTVAA